MTTVNAIFAYPTPPNGDAVNMAFVESMVPSTSYIAPISTGSVVLTTPYELSPATSYIALVSGSGVALSTQPRVIDALIDYPVAPAGDAADIAFIENLVPASSYIALISASGVVLTTPYELSPASSYITLVSAPGVVVATPPRVIDATIDYPAAPSGDAVDIAFVESMAPTTSYIVLNSLSIGKPAFGQSISFGQGIEWGGPEGLHLIRNVTSQMFWYM